MDKTLSNKIAAGEVIERPASVVKELVENSIDAGATRISIKIERAGSKLISVSDNGCGMDEDDALLCFEQHGTSKLISANDLEEIATLGFRGEAIPSISSISRFTLQTRTKDSPTGTKVRVDGGTFLESSPCGCPVGTTVEIRDIFFNTPARKKFLKTANTEEHHIEEAIISLALAHPEVGFSLYLDNNNIINTAPGGTLELRIREFFGRNFLSNMIKVEHSNQNYKVFGFIAAPGFTRPTRKEQRTFVNMRAVEALAMYKGIKDGYMALHGESGRYPAAIIFLEIDPKEVDVNVHPAKREVRFKSEFQITKFLEIAIANALSNFRLSNELSQIETKEENELLLSNKIPLNQILMDAQVSYHVENYSQDSIFTDHNFVNKNTTNINENKTSIKEETTEPTNIKPILKENSSQENISAVIEQTPKNEFLKVETSPTVNIPKPIVPQVEAKKVTTYSNNTINEKQDISLPKDVSIKKEDSIANISTSSTIPKTPIQNISKQPPRVETNNEEDTAPFAPKRGYGQAEFQGAWPQTVLGILDDTYILCSSFNGLTLIDQHAAHERIMFEKLLQEAEKTEVISQSLLIPIVIVPGKYKLNLLLKNRAIFEKLGFEFELVGNSEIMLSAIPLHINIPQMDYTNLISDMLDELLENDRLKNHIDMEATARAACHAAIKAHQALTIPEAHELIKQLSNCRQGTLCPHGRPTMITLSISELEKRFGRK